MRKDEIVKRIAEETGLTQLAIEDTVNAILDEIKRTLQCGDSVTLRGFGAFHVRDKNARTGRNPHTGEEVPIPPRRIARFKPGKQLKAAANESMSESFEPTT